MSNTVRLSLANRELWLGRCMPMVAIVANTYIEYDQDFLVPYYGMSATVTYTIDATDFAQIEFWLIGKTHLETSQIYVLI